MAGDAASGFTITNTNKETVDVSGTKSWDDDSDRDGVRPASITVSDKAGTTIGSSAQLRPGDTMSLKTALQGLLVPSGNDAAVAIAETVGARLVTDAQPDPEGAFVDAMNAKAAEIGCTDTLFTNPHGLDSDGYESDAHSTAHDVAKMTAYAMQNDTFRSIVGGGDVTVTVTQKDGTQRAITLISTDELLGVYDGMVGVKTGTGDVALNCFAGACASSSRGRGPTSTTMVAALGHLLGREQKNRQSPTDRRRDCPELCGAAPFRKRGTEKTDCRGRGRQRGVPLGLLPGGA